ncbi:MULTISPECIES: hypothetical protein [unclassified Enterococcus]|uniref:hypothetical protein n=1 Tax=unclassified Enterococcus TaxID=2608891 RepID=UPI001557955B|nr:MULTISPECIES: hypothetical protein [unclassified Enterococcus]MBS7577144.1 hypothetical protein [Enterococcus sp. MMGLQ5-2]MBS7584409.1 hypothetical protein [Enterococcus sp. MMGLQ5-1]NPD12264.1 hypothetical protein [Enterococcus sp. MMGLQ5-1]NPD36978.1 hypothetical protein [Enterococcus sp. MMGLQ5-2]
MYKERNLSSFEAVFFLIIAIGINALGMGLTVATNFGSAMWTASAVNIAQFLNLTLGLVLIIYGVIQIAVNCLLSQMVDYRRIIGNLIVVCFFGMLVAVFTHFFRLIGVPELSVTLRVILDIVGTFCVGIGISISQRINLLLHPWDELTNILRFKYFKGDPRKAQIVTFLIPLMIILILFFKTGRIAAVNFGTIFAFCFQGSVIGWSDNHIHKRLVHRISY